MRCLDASAEQIVVRYAARWPVKQSIKGDKTSSVPPTRAPRRISTPPPCMNDHYHVSTLRVR